MSVVVANRLHREIVEGLLAAGKHVLCEKPLADTLEDARAMARAAAEASTIARIGLTFRRAPGIAYIRDLIRSGELGQVFHVSIRYWTDYAADPMAAISWRFKGPQGSGALADVGSHASYLAEFLAGEIAEVSGGRFSTVIAERPTPIGAVAGHGHTEVSDVYERVENDDYATFSIGFASGAAGTLEVSRVAAGHANDLTIEVFAERGAARFDQTRPSEIQLFLTEGPTAQQGYRRVPLGAPHPYVSGGMPIDVSGVGFGQNEGFLFQARAFLEEVAGLDEAVSLPRNASFDEGPPQHGTAGRRGGIGPARRCRGHGRGLRRHDRELRTTPCDSDCTTPSCMTARYRRRSRSSPTWASPGSRSTPADSSPPSTSRPSTTSS